MRKILAVALVSIFLVVGSVEAGVEQDVATLQNQVVDSLDTVEVLALIPQRLSLADTTTLFVTFIVGTNLIGSDDLLTLTTAGGFSVPVLFAAEGYTVDELLLMSESHIGVTYPSFTFAGNNLPAGTGTLDVVMVGTPLPSTVFLKAMTIRTFSSKLLPELFSFFFCQ